MKGQNRLGKEHVDKAFRFDSKCLIDGNVLDVEVIVFRNKYDGNEYLYHVAVFDNKKAGP